MPPLIVLVGKAGSGKSSFSGAMTRQLPSVFTRINRDEMRGKGECSRALEGALGKGGRTNRTAIIDCCNLTKEKRSEWIQEAHRARAWCVYFDVDLEECQRRVRHRQGHPTIPAGEFGMPILRSMEKQLQPPTLAEGFEKIFVVKTFEDSDRLLDSWHIPSTGNEDGSEAEAEAEAGYEGGHEGRGVSGGSPRAASEVSQALLKFPRTPHAKNLGAATRDDKVMSNSDLVAMLSWISGPTSGAGAGAGASRSDQYMLIEEKLDGANMGISISLEGQIMVQNRSHYISAAYHPQFAPLNKWLADHTADLWEVLEPGRHILYGEWLYATHSVKYNRLPSWFVAYDLFDRVTNTFTPRHLLQQLLTSTSIPLTPIVFDSRVPGSRLSVDGLLALVDGPSSFNDQRREGVVIRLCNATGVVARSKLVRSDFIAGNERWNKSSTLECNSLSFE